MSTSQIIYLLPYFLSLAFSTWVVIYAWNHRQVQGASAYAWLSGAQTLMIFGFILELLSPSMEGKIFWDKFQWFATAGATVTIGNFAIQYTGFKVRQPFLVWGFIISVPVLMAVGILTDPILHLVYPNPHLHFEFIFTELQYRFTWLVFTLAIHGYVVIAFSFGLLLRRFARLPRLYRVQVMVIIVGLLLPVISTVLAIFDIRITTLRDSTPITAAIGNVIIAWGIFRYRLLDIVHIARDKVFESMDDIVFVLDDQDRIIDINSTTLQILNLKPAQVIGQFAGPIFAEWPDVVKSFDKPANGNREVIVKRADQHYHFDVKSTLLYDDGGDYQGRIFVARDITRYAALQWKLKQLNEDLEQRVRERTEQLEEAYDTTLEGWANALELRDKETEGHSRRVISLTLKLAQAMGVSPADQVHIRRGAILHDIGKMAIPDEILRKTGPLTSAERNIILEHPTIAYKLLARIPFLQKAIDIPYCHHEKWDGTGYPRRLRGEQIPLAARIFAVADVWDAIQSDRPYNKAWPRPAALEYLQEQAGKYFDPEIVKVFLQLANNDEL